MFFYKNQLFAYLKISNEVLTKKSILSDFYNNNVGKYRDVFTGVENDVAEGNGNNARNAVAAFTPQNDIEAKHKTFYELLFKYQNQTFTTADAQSVLTIANGCPTIDGTVVHQARSLYNVITEQNKVFTDNCNYTNSTVRKNSNELFDEATDLNDAKVLLYPNPNNGTMVLDYNLGQYNNGIVQIMDITGKIITSYYLQQATGLLPISQQELSNGIYFYRILAGNQVLKIDKIVVIK